VLLALGVSNACTNAVAPCVSNGFVVVSDDGGRGLQILDPTGVCGALRVPIAGRIESATISATGTTVFVGLVDDVFNRELVAIAVPDGSPRWRMSLSEGGQPRLLDGVGLVAAEVLAASADGNVLYMSRAVRNDTLGIVAIDQRTQRPIGFSGPWSIVAGGLVPLGPSSVLPTGALLVVGVPNSESPRRERARVYMLSLNTLEPLDSIAESVLAPDEDVWQAIPTGDNRQIYLAGSTQLLRYDLALRRSTAAVARSASGVLALMRDERELVLTDVGTWPDSPGSGLLRIFGPDLQERGTIDVSSPLGGAPASNTAVRTGLAASDDSGRRLYVRSGSEEIGPLYPAQPARLLVVDLPARSVSSVLALRGYGLGNLLVPDR
jgi:hypothetical protein